MRYHFETAFISLLELVAGTGREMRGRMTRGLQGKKRQLVYIILVP